MIAISLDTIQHNLLNACNKVPTFIFITGGNKKDEKSIENNQQEKESTNDHLK